MGNYFFNKISIRRAFILFVALVLTACGGSSSKAKTTHLQGGAIQGNTLALKGEVSTISGAFFSGDGVGGGATFSEPTAIFSDGTYLFVADVRSNVIRKIVIATGAVTTLAGKSGVYGSADGTGAAAGFSRPSGITSDGTYLYITDSGNHTIRKLNIATGAVSTLAGSVENIGTRDGVGSEASFRFPYGIVNDGNHLYVTDSSDYAIRKIVIATGEVTTLAGAPNMAGGSADGIGSAARFYRPQGIASDGVNLYVCDSGNRMIRKIVIATGQVSTLLSDITNGPYIDGFVDPVGIAVKNDALYVTDSYTSSVYRVTIATAEKSLLAGSGNAAWGSSDGIGTAARFYQPLGIASDGNNIYVTDTGNNTIRKIGVDRGGVTTLAGSSASYLSSQHITTDGTYLYTANFNLIQKRAIATGLATDMVQLEPGMVANQIGWVGSGHPFIGGITTDGIDLYVSDTGTRTIRKVALATGVITTLAGAADEPAIVDGKGVAARFSNPQAITTDGTHLYVVDEGAIRKIVIATGAVTTLVGDGTPGSVDGVGAAARIGSSMGITTDGTNLYVADYQASTIRKVVIASRTVTTLAGRSGIVGNVDGIGLAASFDTPAGITTDGTNLYISDVESHLIRKLVIATGAVTTIAGSAYVYGTKDGLGVAATLHDPVGVVTDGVDLYIADSLNYALRKIH